MVKSCIILQIESIETILSIGATDQLCTLDVDIWEHFMTEASNPPHYYDEDFQHLSETFLRHRHGITQDEITTANMSEIYDQLVGYYDASA